MNWAKELNQTTRWQELRIFTAFTKEHNQKEYKQTMKTDKRQKNIAKINDDRKQKTIALIIKAVEYLEDNCENRSVSNVSKATKKFDPLGKGVSEAAFRNKSLIHIQDVMEQQRIGPYASLPLTSDQGSVDTAEFIKLAKDNKALQKKLDEKIETIKNLKKELKKLKVANAILRHETMALHTKLLSNSSIPQSNNTYP